MGYLDRIKTAVQVLTGTWKSGADITAMTVSPSDVARQGRYVQRPFRELVQRYSGYVYVCASRNAQAVSRLPLKAYRKRQTGGGGSAWASRGIPDYKRRSLLRSASPLVKRHITDRDDLEEITDPNFPGNWIWDKANPRDNGNDVLESLGLGLELTGNAYLMVVPGKNRWPSEIWPLWPQFVNVQPDLERFVSGYWFGVKEELREWIDARQVIHLRFANPLGDPYYGMGPLAACVVQADLYAAAAQHALSVFDNNAQPGLVVNMPGADDKQRERVEAQIRRKFQGVSKAARSLVMSAPKDTTVTKWEMGLQEAHYLNSQKDWRATICNVFGVPETMVELGSAALATAQETMPQYYELSIMPRAQRIESKLNEQLAPMYGEDVVFLFDNPMVNIDPTAAEAQRLLWDSDVLTKNEIRDALGLPPVADGEQYKSQSVVKADPFGLGGGGDFIDLGDGKQIERPAIKGAEEAPAIDVTDENEKPEPPAFRSMMFDDCCQPFDHITRDDKATAKDRPDRAVVAKMVSALRRWFERAVMPHAAATIQPEFFTGAVELNLADTPAIVDSLEQAIGDKQATLYRGGVTQGVTDVYSAKPAGSEPTAAQVQSMYAPATAYLEARRATLVRSLSVALNDRLTTTMQEGILEGLTGPQLTEAVQTTLGGVTNAVAGRIAMTEASRAFNGGRESAWLRDGGVASKEWLESGDPCPICDAIVSGKRRVVPLNQPFFKAGETITGTDGKHYRFDYGDVDHPPAHPHCRCGLGAVFAENKP